MPIAASFNKRGTLNNVNDISIVCDYTVGKHKAHFHIVIK